MRPLLPLLLAAALAAATTPEQEQLKDLGSLGLDPVEMMRAVTEPLEIEADGLRLRLEDGALLVVRSGRAPSLKAPSLPNSQTPVGFVFSGQARLIAPLDQPELRLHSAAFLSFLGAASSEVNNIVALSRLDIPVDLVVGATPDPQLMQRIDLLPPLPPADPRVGLALQDAWQRSDSYNEFVAIERLRANQEPDSSPGLRLAMRTDRVMGLSELRGVPEGEDLWLRLAHDPWAGASPHLRLAGTLPRPPNERNAIVDFLAGNDVGLGLPGGDPSRADNGDPQARELALQALQRSVAWAEVPLLERWTAAEHLGAPLAQARAVSAQGELHAELTEKGWTCHLRGQAQITLRAEGGPVRLLRLRLPGVLGADVPEDLSLSTTEGQPLTLYSSLAPALVQLPQPLNEGESITLTARWSQDEPVRPDLGCAVSARIAPEPISGTWDTDLRVSWPAGALWSPVLPPGELGRALDETSQRLEHHATREAPGSTVVNFGPGLSDWGGTSGTLLQLRAALEAQPSGAALLEEALQLLLLPLFSRHPLPSGLSVVGTRSETIPSSTITLPLGESARATLLRQEELSIGLSARLLEQGRPAPEQSWLLTALSTAMGCQLAQEQDPQACVTRWRTVRQRWGPRGGWLQLNPARLPSPAQDAGARGAAAFLLGVSLPSLIGEQAWWAGVEHFLSSPAPLSLNTLQACWEKHSTISLEDPFKAWFGAGLVPKLTTRRSDTGKLLRLTPPVGLWPIPLTNDAGELRWELVGDELTLPPGTHVHEALLLHR